MHYIQLVINFFSATLRFALPNVVYIDKGYQKNKCSGFVRPVQRKSAAYKTDGPLPMKKGFHNFFYYLHWFPINPSYFWFDAVFHKVFGFL